MSYTTGDIAKRFNVSRQTVRRWADEYFPDFLSPESKSDKGARRIFNDADMGVFSLWMELEKQGKDVETVRGYLRTGERRMPPPVPPTEEQKDMMMSQVYLMNQELKLRVEELEDEIDRIKNESLEKDKRIAGAEARENLVTSEWQKAQKRAEELMIELALLKRQLGQS
jgi:DNA-binding transcriptional MerR regulator